MYTFNYTYVEKYMHENISSNKIQNTIPNPRLFKWKSTCHARGNITDM